MRRVLAAAVTLLALCLTLLRAQAPQATPPADDRRTSPPAPAGADLTRQPGVDAGGPLRVPGPTVVLDPGHGGSDVGTRGTGGTEEKQLTLDIARRLRPLLEAQLGARVVLTREADVAVTTDARVALANSNKGDLFLSLHANAAPSSVVEGAEVYYLQLDREGERARDARHTVSLPIAGGGNRTLDLVPWELAQARHIERSALLAEALAQTLAGRLPVSPSPLRRAPLRILEGIDMPAVLIEVAFLSSPAQEKLAQGEEFRQAMAQVLLDAVARFRQPAAEPRGR